MTESPPFDQHECEEPLPEFTPVPLARHRHDGWTPERQRGFIAALAETGMVRKAAQAVGMSAASAYALRRRAGAEGFSLAWEQVEGEARDRAFAFLMDRAIHGETRPRFYRGKFVGTMCRYETRIAIATLNAAYAVPPIRRGPHVKVDE